MTNIDQNAETLSSFGMTIKQAKVYLALAFLGTALVGEISRVSKVRREEVYRILPKLEKMGLIEKTFSTPVKLKATPVENALEILIRNEEEKSKIRIAELTAKKEEFLDHFRASSKDTKLDNTEQFSLIEEKAVALGKISSLIEKAQSQIEICSSREKLLQFLKFNTEELAQATARGVKTRIISKSSEGIDAIPNAINQTFSRTGAVALRYLESLPNHFLVIDGAEVLIATSIEGYLADNPLLWSNNRPQVMVYARLFDELWNSSVEPIALNIESEVEKLRGFVKQMKPYDHVILLYETSEAKLKVLLNYLQLGLDNNEAVVYVCSEASVEEVKVAMQTFGINVERNEKSGALKVLDYTQHYIIDGRFDKENTKKLWKNYYDQAISKGFKGLRVTGETACFFKHNLVQELVDYEQSLHKALDVPMIAIYSYRADLLMNSNCPKNLYPDLMKAHSKVMFTWADKELGRISIS